jgi:TPR repeat protein
MSYLSKYLKYKNKYIEFKNLLGGCKDCDDSCCKDGELCKGKTKVASLECVNCGLPSEESNSKLKLSFENIPESQFIKCKGCLNASYCSKECQTHHWKFNHKSFCIPIKDRKPGQQTESGNCQVDTSHTCVICLSKIDESETLILPCKHIFHESCILKLRIFGKSLKCPICRVDLPYGALEEFEDAIILYSQMEKDIAEVKFNKRDKIIKQKLAEIIPKIINSAKEYYIAQLWLADFYNNNNYKQLNLKESFKWFNELATQNFADAQYQVGYCYETGKGVEENIEEAIRYYKLAIAQDQPDAMVNYGIMLLEGTDNKKNIKQAYDYFIKAIEKGVINALNFAAYILYSSNNDVICKDLKLAIQFYEKAIKAGNESGIFWYAKALFEDEGEDSVNGFKYMLKSAENGIVEAQSIIGIKFYNKKDFKNAFKWLKNPSESDKYLEAKFKLGLIYLKDLKHLGIPNDKVKGKEFIIKSASLGFADAQLKLGSFYQKGQEDFKKDIDIARNWYDLAAKQGNKIAVEFIRILDESKKSE